MTKHSEKNKKIPLENQSSFQNFKSHRIHKYSKKKSTKFENIVKKKFIVEMSKEAVDSCMRPRSSCHVKPRKSKVKCARPGRVTRNSFFNFLRDYRRQSCGKSMVTIAKEGARKWKCLSECEKKRYVDMACNAPKMKRKMHSKGMCQRKPKPMKRAPSCKENQCMKKRSSLASRCAAKRARRPKKMCCN